MAVGETEWSAAEVTPIWIAEPSVETVYQLMVFPVEVAFKFTLFPWQIVVADGVTEVGADGVLGCVFINAFPEDVEVQLEEFVTVNEYVCPAVNPETVPLVPLELKLPDGLPVTVQLPLDGNPLNSTLPVEVVQVGCVMVPKVGAVGSGFTVKVPELVPVPPGFVT